MDALDYFDIDHGIHSVTNPNRNETPKKLFKVWEIGGKQFKGDIYYLVTPAYLNAIKSFSALCSL